MTQRFLAAPFLLASGFAFAQTPTPGADGPNCVGVPRAMPLLAGTLPPVSSDLVTTTTPLGAPSGVLSQAYNEAQSVDQVLLRMRIETCRTVANAIPAPSPVNPNDPANYKPRTQYDNAPWRFDMTQNGKRMTADEFDAWMKAKGVRVVGRKDPAATVTPDATGTTPAAQPQQPTPPPKP